MASCGSSTTEGASDVSPFHLFHSAYCMCRFLLGLFVLFACVLLFRLCLVPCFACAAGFLFDYSCGCIQMTDHASTLVRLKKKTIPAPATLHPTPTSYSLPATSLATDLQNTRADIRRQVAATSAPTPIPEEDDDMHDAFFFEHSRTSD